MGVAGSGRGVPVLAIFLIIVGVVLLLQTLAVLPWGLWLTLWKFWPVLLVSIGLALLAGRRAPVATSVLVAALMAGSVGWAVALQGVTSGTTTSDISHPRERAKRLEVSIQFGAGTLVIEALPEGSASLVEGEFTGSRASESFTREGDVARLTLSQEGGVTVGREVRWTLRFSRQVPLVLDVDSGASDIDLDLSALDVSEMNLDMGAASAEVVLPGGTEYTLARIKAGAASVTITVPEGVAARIEVDGALVSTDIDTSRFPRLDGMYRSPDYDAAPRRVDLKIEAAASSVRVK